MSQQPDHFIPKTVDEQIERLTQDSSEQQEMPNQELVHHLHHFYQAQVAGKKSDSLNHAWERITHTKAYLAQYTNTPSEQQKKQARRIRTMKTLPDPITDIPYDEQDMTTPPTRIRRISRFMQSIAAVLLVGVLLGSFLILFRIQHGATGGSSQTRSMIVASATDGTIYAMQPDSGAILWQHATDQAPNGIQPEGSSLTMQGKVVYGVEGTQAYALNALNGTLLWKKALDTSVFNYGMILVDNNVVYISAQVNNGAGHTYALQASTGAVLWYHQTESLLTAANGTVYTDVIDTYGKETMKALSGKSGQLLWQYATEAMTAAVAHDTIYIYAAHQPTPGDNGGNKQYKSLLALNARSGKLLWSKPVIDNNTGPLIIAKNMVIVGTFPNFNSHRDCAYRTNDGSQIWCSEITTDSTDGNVTKSIAVGDTLYTIALSMQPSCQMEARNISNGSLRWSHPCAEIQNVNFSIVGLNGIVFITEGGNSSVISTLDSHGNIQKTFQLSNSGSIASLTAGSW